MVALSRVAFFALLLSAPALGKAAATNRWSKFVREAAARFAIPQQWIWRVMIAESGGQIRLGGQPITSPAGAMGLMQLMPGTWAEMHASYALGNDPFDPHDNVIAGAAYLRSMYDRFGYPGLFAAYNAGPERYVRHLWRLQPLPAETIAYVRKVAGTKAPALVRRGAAVAALPRGSSLFVFKPSAARGERGGSRQSDSLFAIAK